MVTDLLVFDNLGPTVSITATADILSTHHLICLINSSFSPHIPCAKPTMKNQGLKYVKHKPIPHRRSLLSECIKRGSGLNSTERGAGDGGNFRVQRDNGNRYTHLDLEEEEALRCGI